MDGQQTQDQQTKDFMSSFFPQDLPGIEQIQNSSCADQFQFHPTPQPSNSVSMANNASMSSSVNMELLGTIGNLINEQTSSYNPALLLEQQYKLTQLQQLQQLQNQIFQQQVSWQLSFSTLALALGRRPWLGTQWPKYWPRLWWVIWMASDFERYGILAFLAKASWLLLWPTIFGSQS
jgi:hypothetical protein